MRGMYSKEGSAFTHPEPEAKMDLRQGKVWQKLKVANIIK